MMKIQRFVRTASRLAAGMTAVFVVSVWPVQTTQACPLCGAAQMTLSEQLSTSDAAALVVWSKGEMGDKEKIGSTTYRIKQVVKGKGLKPDTEVVLDRFRAGKAGDLFFLLGTAVDDAKLEWGSPLEVTETSYNYMAQAPAPETPTAQRLKYFVKFLEYSDQMIANDAFGEIANAPYQDVVALKPSMPREKLREWITNPQTPATRLGLYGMMLGICGDEHDAEILEKKILEPSKEFRLGIEGLMGGYLVLKGEYALAKLEEHKLKNRDVPFSEVFAVMQALRFLWTYGEQRVPAERLKQSMRILLERPEMADLVIADLARWKDWSMQTKLREMYGQEAYNVPSIKRAIVRYYLAGQKDIAPGGGAAPPEHVEKAKKYLDELRKLDPKTVSEAERFFVLPN